MVDKNLEMRIDETRPDSVLAAGDSRVYGLVDRA